MLVITEMNRNHRSITEIFFLLGGLLAGSLGGRLYWLEKHYRNISCFARNMGSGLGRLSGAGLSGAGYYRNEQKSQKHYRNFLSLGGLLAGALGGCLYWLEKHYRNISCFARNFGFCMGRLSGAGLLLYY